MRIKGISFSGSGHLLPYFLGVIRGLRAHIPQHERDALHVTGASGGALAAVALAAELDDTSLELCIRETNSALSALPMRSFWRLDAALRRGLADALPPDVAVRLARRSGTASVVLGTWKCGRPSVEHVGVLADRDDALETLAATCFVPLFSGPSLTTAWRGRRCVFDGGLLDFQPIPPAMADADLGSLLTVTPLPLGRTLDSPGLAISPPAAHSRPQRLANLASRLIASAFPLDPTELDALVAEGMGDVDAFFARPASE